MVIRFTASAFCHFHTEREILACFAVLATVKALSINRYIPFPALFAFSFAQFLLASETIRYKVLTELTVALLQSESIHTCLAVVSVFLLTQIAMEELVGAIRAAKVASILTVRTLIFYQEHT